VITATSSSLDTAHSSILTFSTASSERARIDSSGRLLVGTPSARDTIDVENTNVTPSFQIEGGTSSTAHALITRYTANNFAGYFSLAKTRSSTVGNHAVVADDDSLGRLRWLGDDGTDFEVAAQIEAFVDGTPGANDMPGRLVFSTTADGASSPTERMRIARGGELLAYSVYTVTTAAAADVNIAANGTLRRSTSSSKYKTDIESIEDNYSDALLNVRPVWYRSTCEADCKDHSYWGFIAEEVAAIDPRLVHWKTVEITHDENGAAVEIPCDPEPEGVAYDRFVPHLLNLIKRQKEQIETMEARLSALETQ